MSESEDQPRSEGCPAPPVAYLPPRVETILTLNELEREVLYAGTVGASTEL
jgi:hypothetical protein